MVFDTIKGLVELGTLGPLVLGILIASSIIFVGLWIYTSFAWSTLGKKLKYKKHWLAWIPFARTSMILQMGKMHWAWVFLWLIPVLGWIPLTVLLLISKWRIYEKRNYPGWLALIVLGGSIPWVGTFIYIAHYIILGLVAWNDIK